MTHRGVGSSGYCAAKDAGRALKHSVLQALARLQLVFERGCRGVGTSRHHHGFCSSRRHEGSCTVLGDARDHIDRFAEALEASSIERRYARFGRCAS